MAFTRIILWLGNTFILCAALMALTAICALGFVEIPQAVTFGGLALVMGVLGVLLGLITAKTPGRESNSDALIFLLLFWIVVPVVTAIPYVANGATLPFLTAYFESVAALTTTGASTLVPDDLPRSILIWRSILQWFGGVSAATFAVVILAALNLAGTGVHRSLFFTLKKGELFERLLDIGRLIAAIYAGVSFISMMVLVISGTPFFDAFCLSLSAVSTGGLTPRGEPISQYVNHFGAIMLALTCICGTFNIAVLWDFFRIRNKAAFIGIFRNVEHRAFIVIAFLLFCTTLIFAGFDHGVTAGFEAVFFATSTGFDYDIIGVDLLPPAVLIAIALIGGSALSTAGGVKLIRMLLLFRHLSTELARLTHPSRIVPVTFRGQILPDRAFLSIWMYFFGYTLVFAVSILALGAVGLDFETAYRIN